MMKKNVEAVRGYLKTLSEDDLHGLHNRLSQKLFNDLATSLQVMEKSPEVDRWLSSAKNYQEFFEMVDFLQQQVELEFKHKSHESSSYR